MAHARSWDYLLGMALVLTIATGCQSNHDEQMEEDSGLPIEAQWSDETWAEKTLEWRAWRRDRLLLPDGYLSLAALDFYPPGEWTVGSGDQVDIPMPGGPETWGTLVLGEDRATAWFVPNPYSDLSVMYPHPDQTDPPIDGAVNLIIAGGTATPSRVGGELHFYVAVRKGDWAVRVRDPASFARQNFVGLDYYPLDRRFQVVGRFEAHPEGQTIPTATVLGEILNEPNPGRVVFELGGETFSLEAIAAASGEEFFFILADRTSGKDTYGLGRFLYSGLPNANGEVVLDFNRAYNPPCAFNAFTTCPLPPPQNRINYLIEAGELKYQGVAGQDPDQLPVN